MKMKIMITGQKGQLGTEIQKQLRLGKSEIGPIPDALKGAEVAAVDLPQLDISRLTDTVAFVEQFHPDIVINCAAYTNVDGCEVNHDTAFQANAVGPRNLAIACEKVGAKLVHVSTDYVFSGRETEGFLWTRLRPPVPSALTALPSCWVKNMWSSFAAAPLLCAQPGSTAITAKISSRPFTMRRKKRESFRW